MRPLSIKMMLRYVTPYSSDDHQPDGGFTNAVLISQRQLGDATIGVSRPYFRNLRVSQLCAGPLFAAILAALALHVLGVVGAGAQEQVVRANAAPVIAVVANVEAVRNEAEMDLPRNAMSLLLSLRISHPDNAISGVPYSTRPEPAVRPLLNFGPEAVEETHSVAPKKGPVTGLRAKTPQMRVRRSERNTTSGANAIKASNGVFLASAHKYNLLDPARERQ